MEKLTPQAPLAVNSEAKVLEKHINVRNAIEDEVRIPLPKIWRVSPFTEMALQDSLVLCVLLIGKSLRVV